MEKTKQADPSSVPRHVAIIMDGNNRWAKKRFLPGVAGHKAGVDAVRAVIEVCAEAGVEVLTLFAFSSENWQRPAAEVSALMDLFFRALRREAKRLNENEISLRIIGDRSRFHPDLQKAMREAEEMTVGEGRFVLQIAANYGGQWDIAQAAQQLARQVQAGHLQPEDISPELLQTCLVTGDLPLPDLCIRTGGEHRISNFLLWQLAYSELYFSDLFWPDFKHEAMRHALADFASRQRRFRHTGHANNVATITLKTGNFRHRFKTWPLCSRVHTVTAVGATFSRQCCNQLLSQGFGIGIAEIDVGHLLKITGKIGVFTTTGVVNQLMRHAKMPCPIDSVIPAVTIRANKAPTACQR